MVPPITAGEAPQGIIAGMDHQRIGRALRALRQRRGLTQAELAAAAGVSQSLVSLIERGHLGSVALRTLRRVFEVLDTRLELQVSWRGGGLDRLLDEAHLALVSRRASTLTGLGWIVALEATYSVYGERGSIDVFAASAKDRAVLVEEVKSDLTSIEAARAQDGREGPPRAAEAVSRAIRLRSGGGRACAGTARHGRRAAEGRPAGAGARRPVPGTDPRGAGMAAESRRRHVRDRVRLENQRAWCYG